MAEKVPRPPNFIRYITTHNDAGKGVILCAESSTWDPVEKDQVFFNVPYTTSEFPANLNNEQDVAEYRKTLARGDLGPVTPHGTVFRVVDIAPGRPAPPDEWLVSQSLDYVCVLEGEVELVLDSGERRRIRRGDIVVQRSTKHTWWNPSKTEWTRIVYTLQACQPLENVTGLAS
ncbi:hypothetical protein BDV59DRAFT_103985 [Aspergillus ambiguus]|uniref:cupin domain-containing protein n=1 Tax=Aspergillus ambiguus TaxID=176160 RepID=UPI003CCDE1C0